MHLPTIPDLHQYLGELVGLLLSIFGAIELLLWQVHKLKLLQKRMTAEETKDTGGEITYS